MRPSHSGLLLAVAAALFFSTSCGEAGEKPFPVRTYNMGTDVRLGHISYTVYETQWLTHFGEGLDARVPKNRFFLVRLRAVNTFGAQVIVPTFALEGDTGKTYPELDNGDGVPDFIGYLRSVNPQEAKQGNALFDVPPGHYKIKLADETGEKVAYVDIPLTFVSETPYAPEPEDKEKKK